LTDPSVKESSDPEKKFQITKLFGEKKGLSLFLKSIESDASDITQKKNQIKLERIFSKHQPLQNLCFYDFAHA